MKYETFKQSVENIVELYEVLSERDKRLEKALGGGDTQVLTEDAFMVLDKLANTLAFEMDDKEELLDYLIYENMLSVDYSEENNRLEQNGKEYPINIETIWKILKKEI